MAFTGTTRGKKKRVIFRAVSLLAGLVPRVLFWDNNEDVISNNLAALILLLPELDRAGLLFPSLEGQGAPQSCQIAKQSKFLKNNWVTCRKTQGIGGRNCFQKR